MNCPACDSATTRKYLQCDVGELLRCTICEAVFLPQELFDTPVEPLYSQDYFTEREEYFFHDGIADDGGGESSHIADFRRGLDLIEAQVGSTGALLDVGCATGSFLHLAHERGWQGQGVEISEFAAAQARERASCEVFCGKLEDAPFQENTLDAITMWDLLEHLPDPLENLVHARRLLKPSGVLLVNTPNENSLLRMIARFFYRGSGGLITAPLNRLYHHYHLFYFSAGALTDLMRRAGLDVAVMTTKHIPMSRGRIPVATKVAMKALSVAERALHAEYELLALALKPRGEGQDLADIKNRSRRLAAAPGQARRS